MKVIVTGGAGFIGSHLVNKLIKKGHKVVVADNLSTGKKENLNKKAKFYKVDICSPKIAEIFEIERPEIVYHYAAQIDVRKSTENPMEDAKINILGSLNLIQNLTSNIKHQTSRPKFIFASSVGVYGEPKTLPVKESHPLNPMAPYPVTKVAVEKYLNYYQSQGLNFVSLRYSNIYGPRQLSEIGEGGAIAIFIKKILNGEKPIIFGSGLQTRDFLFVADAVEAAILSLKAPPGSIYNVSTNKEITIKALLKLTSEILNKKLQLIFKPLQQGEIIKSRIDYSKIKKELGWQPKYNLEKGLRETVKWFSKNGD